MGESDRGSAGFAGQCLDKRRLSSGEFVEDALYEGQVGHTGDAVGAGSKFADGLGASENQFGEDGLFARRPSAGRSHGVLVTEGAGAHSGAGQAHEFHANKFLDGVDGVVIGDFHDRVSIGLLVGADDEGVDGQGVLFRGGDGFFDEDAEDSALDGVQLQHACIPPGRCDRTSVGVPPALAVRRWDQI